MAALSFPITETAKAFASGFLAEMVAVRHLPRLLTLNEAAAYCRTSPAKFAKLIEAGKMPAHVPHLLHWDKVAIDRALDKLSGFGQPEAEAQPEISDLERFKAERAARKAAEKAKRDGGAG